MYNIPFQAINWDQVEKIQYHGEMGIATWQISMALESG